WCRASSDRRASGSAPGGSLVGRRGDRKSARRRNDRRPDRSNSGTFTAYYTVHRRPRPGITPQLRALQAILIESIRRVRKSALRIGTVKNTGWDVTSDLGRFREERIVP